MVNKDLVEYSDNYNWIPGYEGLYAASKSGKIISYWGDEPKELSPTKSQQWLCVHLYGENKESTTYKVHRLILEAFERERRIEEECRHLNGDPKDNRLDNITWGSHSENMKDAFRNNKVSQKGSNNANSKLQEDQVLEIRRLWNEDVIRNQSKLSRMYNVSVATINKIVHRNIWKEL